MEPITAKEALSKLCYTSERTWEGTIYTISDCRFPEYNGKKLIVTLEYGEAKISWIEQNEL